VRRQKAIPFRPPQRRRIHEEVGEQLRDAILDGRFEAGQKLPPERELAEEFQVNRTSVREAIKGLEGLGLVTVRQGDGATVQPLIDASFDVLAPMIYRNGHVDPSALADVMEVIMPLLFEMARSALQRHRAEELGALRRLRDVMANEELEREERFAAGRDVLVLLSDMTRNRVWQMLARRARTLLASDPLREARRRLRRDPGLLVESIDSCLGAIDAGRPDQATVELRRLIQLLGDSTLTPNETHPRASLAS
jgi:GntR family transcriptional repressor for pyruvate dehydrogenase complex